MRYIIVANVRNTLKSCQVKPGQKPPEIGDMMARLVLGDGNMDEWNRARFLSTRTIVDWLVLFGLSRFNAASDVNILQPSQGL